MPSPLARAVEAGSASLDDLLRRLAGYSTANPRVHAGVRFNPKEGLGEMPDASNIDYRGFQAYMKPAEFLGLNPARSHSNSHIVDAINQGREISVPMLYVNPVQGGGWKVAGHEGRGRMMALDAMSPDSLFPVGIHPFGETRARHLSPERLWEEIIPESVDDIGRVVPRAAILNKTPYVRPGLEGDESVIRALLEMIGQ